MDDLTGIGKVSESIEKGTQEVRQLAYDFLAFPVKEAGQLIAEKIRYFRFTNAIRTMQRAKEKLGELHVPVQTVDLKTLVPLLEGASLEEDPEMVEIWAGLLASAATSNQPLVSFVYILREISPIEAKILEIVGTSSIEAMTVRDFKYFGITVLDLLEKLSSPSSTTLAHLGNLVRLGLLQRVYMTPAMTWGNVPLGTLKEDMAGLTPLGVAFLCSCYGPNSDHVVLGPLPVESS